MVSVKHFQTSDEVKEIRTDIVLSKFLLTKKLEIDFSKLCVEFFLALKCLFS